MPAAYNCTVAPLMPLGPLMTFPLIVSAMVKDAADDVSPASVTVTLTEPGAAIKLAGTAAVN